MLKAGLYHMRSVTTLSEGESQEDTPCPGHFTQCLRSFTVAVDQVRSEPSRPSAWQTSKHEPCPLAMQPKKAHICIDGGNTSSEHAAASASGFTMFATCWNQRGQVPHLGGRHSPGPDIPALMVFVHFASKCSPCWAASGQLKCFHNLHCMSV